MDEIAVNESWRCEAMEQQQREYAEKMAYAAQSLNSVGGLSGYHAPKQSPSFVSVGIVNGLLQVNAQVGTAEEAKDLIDKLYKLADMAFPARK
jgi:hypothetical protein